MRDLYKTQFGVQPSELAKYATVAYFPWMIKIIWGMLVDVHIFEKRKTYLVGLGMISILAHLLISLGLSNDAKINTGFLLTMNIA